MVVYETLSAISMVHSYSRNHSLIEIEDDKAITIARESCWTLRANQNISNKAIFHNGHIPLLEQKAIFLVTKENGSEKTITFNLPSLKSFETYVFDAEEIFPDLHKFLESGLGWGTLHFESRSSFTRLLIIWNNNKTDDIQVTHSNFDYSSHNTNLIKSTKPAYMKLPTVYGKLPEVIVYPKHAKGQYQINNTKEFSKGAIVNSKSNELSFTRRDGELPSRIVTALTGPCSEDVSLPFECSLGVIHEKCPPKRFHWFLISPNMPSVIHLTSYEEIHPSLEPIDLVVRLYSDSTKKIEEVVLSYDSLKKVPKEIKVEKIFDLKSIKKFGYISIFSHYVGFFIYSSIKKNNVLTLEHSF